MIATPEHDNRLKVGSQICFLSVAAFNCTQPILDVA